jgi:hypothetical protein
MKSINRLHHKHSQKKQKNVLIKGYTLLFVVFSLLSCSHKNENLEAAVAFQDKIAKRKGHELVFFQKTKERQISESKTIKYYRAILKHRGQHLQVQDSILISRTTDGRWLFE